jgi:hypothetical protein
MPNGGTTFGDTAFPGVQSTDTLGACPSAHLIRVAEAARVTGLPVSLLRKTFIAEHKRPKNVPSPPPHKRIGRAVYIIADRLAAWVENLNNPLPGEGYASGEGRGRL